MANSMAVAYNMKRKKMQEGGKVEKDVNTVGEDLGYPDASSEKGKKEISQIKDQPYGYPEGYDRGFAHGGDVVEHIIKKRYSQGGRVANGGDADLDKMADSAPNNFDDLALRDDLEFSYTGDNSGDHVGDDQEDMDRHDIIARIMKSRSKKDRMPRPA